MTEIECSWIDEEFKGISFNDTRLVKRFKYILKKFMQQAQSNISSCFDSWSSIKGCYRFFSNDKIDKNVIIQKHQNSTISRIEESPEKVFIAHDTTYIDYKKHKKNITLDRVFSSGKGKEGSLGLILHNSLALTSSGVPLGVINQKFVRRETIKHSGRKISSRHSCHTRPITEKESYRWIEAINNVHDLKISNKEVIHIADRESDIYELYRNCNQRQIQFVIRGKENRSINKEKRREKPKYRLYNYFDSLPIMGITKIKFQINKEQKFREANLSIKFKNFTLPPPPSRTATKDGKDLENIKLWGICIKENNPPFGEEPISWFLVTNVETTTIEEAIEKITWYKMRWNIEIFHKILKSGCSIESAQLRDRERLIKYITTKSIIAWRIFWLSRNFSVNETVNCTKILGSLEQELLFRRFNNGIRLPKDQYVSAKEAIIWIAKLGGYIGRNSDPPPGIISLWRGWTRLMNMVDDYKILNEEGSTYG